MKPPTVWAVYRKIEVAKGKFKYARTVSELFVSRAMALEAAKEAERATSMPHVTKAVTLVPTNR